MQLQKFGFTTLATLLSAAATSFASVSPALFLAPPASAQTSDTYEANSWRRFSSPKGGFRVLMPGTPTESIESIKLGNGTVDLHLFSLELEDGKVGYALVYADFPNISNQLSLRRTNHILDSAIEGTVGEGKLLTEQAATLYGYYGKKFKYRDSNGLIGKGRYYWVKQRLYGLLAVARAEADLSQGADKFLNSFQLPQEMDTGASIAPVQVE
ncbi:MAG: hypothetical protein BRC36_11945 [Cyanobacteria bacterium QH_2_48_84]|nr:MAG: hypothetical protein BRC36_11945 [Cyanobacteria bacterium QH_2_48_84]